MASKRVINRCYWAAVKATANMPDDFHSLAMRRVYIQAISGRPDSVVVPTLERYEAKYGPARLKDVSNADLWPARTIVEDMKPIGN